MTLPSALAMLEMDEDDYGSKESAIGWSIGIIILGIILIVVGIVELCGDKRDVIMVVICMVSGCIYIPSGVYSLWEIGKWENGV